MTSISGFTKRVVSQVREQVVPQREKPNALTPVRSLALRAHAGQDGFDVAKKARTDARPLPPEPPVKTPDEQRREAIDRALATGEPQEFTNSDGKVETVEIDQTSWWFDGDTYDVKVGDDRFTVTFDTNKAVDKGEIFTKLVDAYSETPQNLRTNLNHVLITKDSHETDTGQSAAATAGDGRVTFYDNGQWVDEGVFHHEMGHLIGRAEENEDDGLFSDWFGEPAPVPNGWDDAAKADGNFSSDYAKADHDVDHNYTEDFAEAAAGYMAALDGGPAAMAAFKQQFPARYEILKGIYGEA